MVAVLTGSVYTNLVYTIYIYNIYIYRQNCALVSDQWDWGRQLGAR